METSHTGDTHSHLHQISDCTTCSILTCSVPTKVSTFRCLSQGRTQDWDFIKENLFMKEGKHIPVPAKVTTAQLYMFFFCMYSAEQHKIWMKINLKHKERSNLKPNTVKRLQRKKKDVGYMLNQHRFLLSSRLKIWSCITLSSIQMIIIYLTIKLIFSSFSFLARQYIE